MPQDLTQPDASNNAYQSAISNVNSTIATMTGIATQFLGTTEGYIQKLGNWNPPYEGTPPTLVVNPVAADGLPDIAKPNSEMFGTVSQLVDPVWKEFTGFVDSFAPVDPGPFNPTTSLPNIPGAPPPLDTSGAPSRPTINSVALPADPNYTLPTPDALDPINLPTVPTIVVPQFDVQEIDMFDEAPPILELNYSDDPYAPLVLNEVTATIKSMLNGGFAMPPAVQAALWGAARDREDVAARKRTDEAVDEWAGRGFSMPPGMLVEQVNSIQDANQLQANTHSREVYSKGAEWAIQNLREAVARGIALESMWSQHWNQIQGRALQAAEAVLQAVKDRYNLLAVEYSLKLQSIQAKREVFEAKLRAELAKLDILRAEIEAEQLKGQVNEQKVRVYVAQLDAVKIQASIFNDKLTGVKIKSDMELAKLDGYKTDVQAWGEKLRGEKTRFDAYDSRIKGEVSKTQAYEAEARAYAATVQAAGDRNRTQLQVIQTKLQAVETSVRKYLGDLQASLGNINAERDAISARATAWGAGIAYSAEKMRYYAQGEEIKIRASESTARNNIAQFSTISRQYDARMERLVQKGNAVQSALGAAGQMSAQMAAGAMSAIHASASVGGSGAENTSFNVHWNYEPVVGN